MKRKTKSAKKLLLSEWHAINLRRQAEASCALDGSTRCEPPGPNSTKFTDKPRCAKCGNKDINWSFVRAEGDRDHRVPSEHHERWQHPNRDHFDMRCRRCHYEWAMEIKGA